MTTAPDSAQRSRNRTMLLVLAALFLGSFVVAGVLRFSGWRPEGLKNRGELLEPYADLRALTPALEDGTPYAWNPEARTWRIVIAPPKGCAASCVALAGELDLVWQLFGKDADHVDLLWFGAPPAGAKLNHKPPLPMRTATVCTPPSKRGMRAKACPSTVIAATPLQMCCGFCTVMW